MGAVSRWSIVEYGSPADLIGPIANSIGLPTSQIRELILNCGSRAGKALGFSFNPISVVGNKVRARDFAGLLRVSPGIEIEIAPKFLGLEAENPRWREDFFFLATLSKHGRLLASERLKASSGEKGDLHTLVARAMVDMYWSNHRRPLRSYRINRFSDFSIEGDVEPEDLLQPGPDGFEQSSIVYDRRNPYNSIIFAAARDILPNLREPTVIGQTERMIQILAPQRPVSGIPKNRRVPSRSKRWQPLYDLSVDVLSGFGMEFKSGNSKAPGYVVNTWRIWEDLLGVALRMGFGSKRVKSQDPSPLGTRERLISDAEIRMSTAFVKPDLMISRAGIEGADFLVDAKYKGKGDAEKIRVDEADIYESMAFSRATCCEKIILAYPPSMSKDIELGQVIPFERVTIGNVQILGVEIGISGISRPGGLVHFSRRCCEEIEAFMASTI